MKCKKLVSLFLSLLLATALAVPACAAFEDVFADGSADGTRDGSLFLSGETVRSSAAVNGILLAAGRTVGVNGTGAYVMAAGYEVTLGGTAENDAFLAGYSIGVNGAAPRSAGGCTAMQAPCAPCPTALRTAPSFTTSRKAATRA